MKSILAAAAFAIPLALTASLATAPAADAKTSVRIIVGVPYYGYSQGPDYRYRHGYGWYRRGNSVGSTMGNGRISCGEARNIVQRKGYNNVTARDCSGSTYTFRVTRNGNVFQVLVNARTGQVWHG